MEAQRTRALAALDKHPPGATLVILFNSSSALTFRGLYVLEGGGLAPGDTAVRKVYGAGPAIIRCGCWTLEKGRKGRGSQTPLREG